MNSTDNRKIEKTRKLIRKVNEEYIKISDAFKQEQEELFKQLKVIQDTVCPHPSDAIVNKGSNHIGISLRYRVCSLCGKEL